MFQGMAHSSFIIGSARTPRPARLGEYDRVRLTAGLSDQGKTYPAGSTGTVVHVHRGGVAFEVEITAPMHGVVTVAANAVEAVSL